MTQQAVGNLNVKVSASTEQLAEDLAKGRSLLTGFASSAAKALGKIPNFSGAIGREAQSAIGMLRSFSSNAVGAFAGISRMANPVSGLMPSFEQLKTIGVASFGAVTIAAIKFAAQAEQVQVAYKTLIGAGGDYAATLKEIRQFAAVTPFGSTELLAAGKQLLAYGTSADQLLPTIATLGDAAAATATPMSDLVYLFGTLRTQGRAFTIDIRQFANRGIPIWEELAKVMKVNVSQVQKLVEDGRVGFPEVVKAFKSMSAEGGRFHKMMESQSQTLAGLFEGLKDNVEMTLIDVGNMLVEAFDLKQVIRDATDFTKKIRESTHIIKPYVQELAGYIKSFSSTVTLKDMLEGGKEIALWASSIANGVYVIGRTVLAFGQGVASALAPVGSVLGDGRDWLANWKPNIESAKLAGVDLIEYIVAGFEHIENAFTAGGAALKRGLIVPMMEMQAVITEVGAALQQIPLLGGGTPLTESQQQLRAIDEQLREARSLMDNRRVMSNVTGRGSSEAQRSQAYQEFRKAESQVAILQAERKKIADAVAKEGPTSVASQIRTQALAIKKEAEASENYLKNGAESAKGVRRAWFDAVRFGIKTASKMAPKSEVKVDANIEPAKQKIRELVTDFGLPQWLKDKDQELIKKWTSDVVKFKKEFSDLNTLNVERFWENLQKGTPSGMEIQSMFEPFFKQFEQLQGVADAPGLLDQYNEAVEKLSRHKSAREGIIQKIKEIPGGKSAVAAFGKDIDSMLKTLPEIGTFDVNPLKETISSLKFFDPKMIREQFLPIVESLPGLKIPVKFIKENLSELLPFDRTYSLELAEQFRSLAKNIPQIKLPSAAIEGSREAVSAVNEFQMGKQQSVEDILVQIRRIEEQQLVASQRLANEIRAVMQSKPELFNMQPR